jgi:hypothetical protein
MFLLRLRSLYFLASLINCILIHDWVHLICFIYSLLWLLSLRNFIRVWVDHWFLLMRFLWLIDILFDLWVFFVAILEFFLSYWFFVWALGFLVLCKHFYVGSVL